MIFPDYGTIEIVVACLVFGGGSVYIFRRVTSSKLAVKLAARLISGLVVLCSTLALGMFGCASAWNVTTHSPPIYSPDGLHAVRITNTDAGALGGYTNITLYSHHGLVARNIFSGDWKAAQPDTVHWLSDSQIEIGHDASYIHPPRCYSANDIVVRCKPVTDTYPR